MTNTDEKAIEREIETLHQEWAERRADRDVQSMIRIANLAYFAAFEGRSK